MRTPVLLVVALFTALALRAQEGTYSIELQGPLGPDVQQHAQEGMAMDRDLDDLCLPISEGRFWGVSAGVIREFTISGSTITGGATIQTAPTDMLSLAFCSASGPTTFYGDATDTGIQYFDNGIWNQVPLAQSVYNHGGSGQHLYFVDLSNDLYHFSGTSSTLIFDPSPSAIRSDVVVNSAGNAVVAFGPEGIGTSVTEYREYSPAGALLHTYAVTFPHTLAWGSFMLGNVVYVAFGSSNPVYANMLLPITLSGTTGTLGTPIFFPQSEMFDLASCTENTVGLAELAASWGTLATSPNPAADHVLVRLPQTLRNQKLDLRFIDARGSNFALPGIVQADGLRIDTSTLPAGLYHVVLTTVDGHAYSARVMRE